MSDDKVIDSGEDVEMNKAMEMPLDTSKDVGSSNKKWWIIGGVAIFGLVILVLAVALPLALITPASMTSTGGSITTIETSSTVYTSTDGPFNVSLGLFNEGITRGYDSEAELKDDLANAAYFLLNQAVKRNAGVKGYESVGFGFGQQILTIGAPTDEAAQSDGAVNKGVGNNLNDFGTNNQESGVEEGDLIVSDGTLGKLIELWRLLACSRRSYFRLGYSVRRIWRLHFYLEWTHWCPGRQRADAGDRAAADAAMDGNRR